MDLKDGDVFVVENYPFVRNRAGDHEVKYLGYAPEYWSPGVRYEMVAPDSSAPFCDGFGKQVLTVVSTHKPGRFPERVFYTRKWIDPDGKEFGRRGCRVAVKSKFVRLTRCYGSDNIYLEEPELAREKKAAAV